MPLLRLGELDRRAMLRPLRIWLPEKMLLRLLVHMPQALRSVPAEKERMS